MWTNAWAEFVPFLQFDQDIRTVICATPNEPCAE
jgi:transposase-like protein